MENKFLIHTTNRPLLTGGAQAGKVKAGRVTINLLGKALLLPLAILLLSYLQACTSSAGSGNPAAAPPPSLPVLTLGEQPVTTYDEFTTTLEGSKDIEIRPQVDGQLTNIYVDEGDFVKKGQVLFRINDRIYAEQLNNARANLAVAKANLAHAEIEVSKLTPLVKNKVISEIQLKSAEAAQLAAEASVMQAESMIESARINLGYTAIRAPADGYIGRIPFKTGSLAHVSNPEALTVLSEINNVFVYFSLSEHEFMQFKKEFPGNSVAEKIEQLPPVELLLADGSLYPQKGEVELVSGQFDNSMGAISFRAVFPNAERLLRSGNTGRVRIPHSRSSVILVPQQATFELQDKIFVFALDSGNAVVSKPIEVSGTSGTSYLVESGVHPGDKIVYSGLERLKDGAVIEPQLVSIDSVATLGAL